MQTFSSRSPWRLCHSCRCSRLHRTPGKRRGAQYPLLSRAALAHFSLCYPHHHGAVTCPPCSSRASVGQARHPSTERTRASRELHCHARQGTCHHDGQPYESGKSLACSGAAQHWSRKERSKMMVAPAEDPRNTPVRSELPAAKLWGNGATQARTTVSATLTRVAWARSVLLLCDTALWTQHTYQHGLTRPSAMRTLGVGGGGRFLWLQALRKRSDYARGIAVAAARSKWTDTGAWATGKRVSLETQPGPRLCMPCGAAMALLLTP